MLNKTVAIAVQGLFLALSFNTRTARAQSVSGGPTGVSSRTVIAPTADQPDPVASLGRPSSRQIQEAEDIYLQGAKQFAHKRFNAAEQSFERAVKLNPGNRNYALALLFTRETLVTRLVREAAVAQQLGETTRANALLTEGRTLDPTNPGIAQHFEQNSTPATPGTPQSPHRTSSLAGPIELEPDTDEHSFHLYGDLRDIIRGVYNAFGIAVTFDSSVPAGTPVRFDVDDIDFSQATQILAKMSGIFGVPIQPGTALIAKDTKERRDALMPLVEETIYLPGQSQQQLLELANLARTMFNLKMVAVSNNSGSITLRGEENILKLIDATYADLIDSRSDVLLDLTLYEIDSTNVQNIGFAPPASATAIDVSGAAQSLISSNQTLLNQSIASGAITLTGSTATNELEEVAFLVAAGVPGSSQFTSLLGTIGNFQGVPLAGISVGSATFNLLMSSTDVRTLDALQLRAGNAETATFRVGSRYPILTSLSTASTSNTLATELAAAGVSSSLITQLGGTTSTTTVPQIQFEDIGITLKITPSIMDDGAVRLAVDFKIEALDGTGVDGIPILDNHALTSTVTVPGGETTMLATLVSTNETKLLDGEPGLNDLPGFQSTDTSTNGTKNELLITVTPHIVHSSTMRVTDRILAVPRSQRDATASSTAVEHTDNQPE